MIQIALIPKILESLHSVCDTNVRDPNSEDQISSEASEACTVLTQSPPPLPLSLNVVAETLE